MADNSRSLQLRDREATMTRGESMEQTLGDQQAWRVRAGQDFDVRNYQFDTRLSSVDSFTKLTFEGRGTSLSASLTSIAQRYRGRPVAGILLLTDGNSDLKASDDWSQLPPVFAVPMGKDAPARDVRIDRISVSQANFETAPVSIQVDVASEGYEGEPLMVELLDEDDQVVQHQELTAPKDDDSLTLHFDFRPDNPGLRFYQVRAFSKAEGEQFATPAKSEEATLSNNVRRLLVDRGGGPYRVLYVAGRPNWEFKFLRRALAAEQEIDLVGLIRIAKREPKFDFRSRAGEKTNPLFRGFGNTEDEQAEQYDEPVLLRLGIEDEVELRDGFPQTADVLFRYDAIIIDDVEADFFNQDQMLALQTYVNQRGGGLMMLAGQESFENGGYERTPLGDLLPVYLSRFDGLPDDGKFRLKLTRDGMHPPWSFFRVRSTITDEHKRLEEMPNFVTLNRVSGVKPGAVILASATDAQGQNRPALAAQRFGAGRTSALLIGDLWRWGMRRAEDEPEHDLNKVWRQTLRWLVSETPQRIETKIENSNDATRLGRDIRVTLRDEEYRPLDNAQVEIVVETPEQSSVNLTALPDDAEPGVYHATFIPRQAGAFRVKVSATGADGADVGNAEAGWTAEPDRLEFERLRPNREALENLAEQTEGEVVELEDLNEFVQSLPDRKIPLVETWVYSWWDLPFRKLIVFSLLMIALCFDWGVRRLSGLA